MMMNPGTRTCCKPCWPPSTRQAFLHIWEEPVPKTPFCNNLTILCCLLQCPLLILSYSAIHACCNISAMAPRAAAASVHRTSDSVATACTLCMLTARHCRSCCLSMHSTTPVQEICKKPVRPHHNTSCLRGYRVAQVLRAVPKGARLLLECAGAVVAAAPSKFKVSCLT